MPLLPRTRQRLGDDISEAENRLDGWIRDLDDLVTTAASVHPAYMRAQAARITQVRSTLASLREGNHAASA